MGGGEAFLRRLHLKSADGGTQEGYYAFDSYNPPIRLE